MSSSFSPACLLLVLLLPLQALAQPLGVAECRGWRERRDQLAAEAMQAEIALVLAMRRRLCPRQEALAEQANANGYSGAHGDAGVSGDAPAARPDAAGQADFDYAAYLQCRREAEARLGRSQVILYTNRRGFTYYTRDGARLAREADDWQQRLSARCPSPEGR